jgi:hypothetical protein
MLILPVLQAKLNFFPKQTLIGAEERVEKRPAWSFEQWEKGLYQEAFTKWLNQRIGLREYYVKTYNQLSYSLFNEAAFRSNIVIGKEGNLIQREYIDDYLNVQPLCFNNLDDTVKMVRELQDILATKGVALLTVITPSKAAIYPEYIPDSLMAGKHDGNRNYDNLIMLFEKYGVNYVDGHLLTANEKAKQDYPVFCKGGTHWNSYAAYFTTVQMIDKIWQLTGKKISNVYCMSVDYDNIPTGTDRDLLNLLNLWVGPDTYPAPHPVFTANGDGSEIKPSILLVGASFTFQILNIISENKIFSDEKFYYYYKQEWLSHTPLEPTGINWDHEVFSNDVIVLEVNESNVHNFGFGFIQDAYARLRPDDLASGDVNLIYKNGLYVEEIDIDNKNGYLIKKGAPGGTMYLSTNNMDLETDVDYVVSYIARGYPLLKCDLFPDDLPQYNNKSIDDTYRQYTYTFRSSSNNMHHAELRFFIDGVDSTDKDTYLYDIKFYKKADSQVKQ